MSPHAAPLARSAVLPLATRPGHDFGHRASIDQTLPRGMGVDDEGSGLPPPACPRAAPMGAPHAG
ncbi:MAG: hypothetical protein WCG13_09450 [Burkholderiales bacterium]